jgi:hypothetical protein
VGYSHSNEFARQLAERNGSSSSTKKFRSTAAPKGAKLPEGYVDRAKTRGDEEESDKVKRVKALEEMFKLGQIDEATFIKLRDEILGKSGAIERAGLVKGLDRELLERYKKGEVSVSDILDGGKSKDKDEDEEEKAEEDVDDEFEKLESREVEAVVKEREKKKGEMAPPALTGKKRNRDQILAELKAARAAAKEAAQPSLGARFKKVGDRRAESRIERDSKGREVLITVDEDGNEKRKIRKVQALEPVEKGHGLLMPDKDAKPLGMEVPEIPKVEEEDEEINIFNDAGDDYDPLAGLDEDDSDEEEKEDGEVAEDDKGKKVAVEENPVPRSMAPPPRPKQSQPSAPRNYFGESHPEPPEETGPKALSDPTFLAALKKASTLNPISKAPESEEEAAKEARRKKMLQQDDRDAEDMDMGFGSSRFADEEDFEEKKVKLSKWGGGDDEDEKGGKGEGEGKRKRGPKKRKGDGNSAADVMRVLEKRKAAGS